MSGFHAFRVRYNYFYEDTVEADVYRALEGQLKQDASTSLHRKGQNRSITVSLLTSGASWTFRFSV